jgi:hypothetical protein
VMSETLYDLRGGSIATLGQIVYRQKTSRVRGGLERIGDSSAPRPWSRAASNKRRR